MGFGADDAQDGSYGGDFGGSEGGAGDITKAIRDAFRSYWGGPQAPQNQAPQNFNREAIYGFSPNPLDPMSAGLGRPGIAPPNWGSFDTQQAYGNFKGLNPNWGNWDNQQANVGALKGFGPWSNVTSPFEPMSGGNISRGYREPDYNEGGW